MILGFDRIDELSKLKPEKRFVLRMGFPRFFAAVGLFSRIIRMKGPQHLVGTENGSNSKVVVACP